MPIYYKHIADSKNYLHDTTYKSKSDSIDTYNPFINRTFHVEQINKHSMPVQKILMVMINYV